MSKQLWTDERIRAQVAGYRASPVYHEQVGAWASVAYAIRDEYQQRIAELEAKRNSVL